MSTIGVLLGPLPRSLTTRHVSRLLHEAAPTGTRLVELDISSAPHGSPQMDVPLSADALAWKRAIADLDGLLVLTPAHERSIPGALKSALDWAGGAVAPNALAGLPVVIAGVHEDGSARFSAIQHLRTVLGDAGARLKSQPEITLAIDATTFGATGACTDPELAQEARELISAAAGHVAHQARTGLTREAASLSTDVMADLLAAPTGPQSAVDGLPIASSVRTRVA